MICQEDLSILFSSEQEKQLGIVSGTRTRDLDDILTFVGYFLGRKQLIFNQKNTV